MTSAAPRHARPFVAGFLTLLVVCALVPLNLWPFSNWELFSRVRSPLETSWEAIVVRPGGRVVSYPLRARVDCVRVLHGSERVSIYRVERSLSDRVGAHAAPPHRELAATCTAKDMRAAG